jgi:polyphenol oxidase
MLANSVIIPDWPAPPSVRAMVTTRATSGQSPPPFDRCNLGLRSGDDARVVISNRLELGPALALPASPRWMQQVHGVEVARFDRSHTSAIEAQADAAITSDADVVLAVLTADCLPLLVCADDGSEIAAIHAGWRGLAAGVIETAIASFHLPGERLLVWLGPSIGPRSYEIGSEVYATFVTQNARAAAAFIPTRAGHWLCDLYTLARLRLAALGVRRIFGGGFDTFADPRFYSYRREPVTGRFASLIWRVD